MEGCFRGRERRGGDVLVPGRGWPWAGAGGSREEGAVITVETTSTQHSSRARSYSNY